MPRKPTPPTTLRSGLTLKQAIALPDNPDFRLQARNLRDLIADPSQFGGTKQENQLCLRALVGHFVQKWGVLPPVSTEYLFGEERGNQIGRAIQSGRWGLIPVYEWTADKEVGAAKQRIQAEIMKGRRDTAARKKAHGDTYAARRKAEIVRWLEEQTDAQGRPISRADIAAELWGLRKQDLRRLTPEEAFRRLPEEKEREWMTQYRTPELSRYGKEVSDRVLRRARGSESKGLTRVRKTVSRYDRFVRNLKGDVEQPKECDPIAYQLTMAYRALIAKNRGEEAECLFALYDRLLGIR